MTATNLQERGHKDSPLSYTPLRSRAMKLTSSKLRFPAPLVTALEQKGYRTGADLLFGASAEDIFRQLPINTIGFNEFQGCLARVLEASSAEGSDAGSLLRGEATTMATCCLATGVDDLDELLAGLGGTVIEISGDIGSGKSMLATHIALRHLTSDPDAQLLWVDTTGNFLVDQVAELLTRHSGQGVATALERLHLSLAFDLDSAYQVLHSVHHPSCIVIDSITPLLGPTLSAVSAQGHALMVGFMRHLRALAQSSNASVLRSGDQKQRLRRDGVLSEVKMGFYSRQRPQLLKALDLPSPGFALVAVAYTMDSPVRSPNLGYPSS
ncbi:hypothetical protein EYR40_006798 [Pleurotus pulmonarius]|nr:hypothetical protein EYR40_006798 [Pleurotus pulmonarius]